MKGLDQDFFDPERQGGLEIASASSFGRLILYVCY